MPGSAATYFSHLPESLRESADVLWSRLEDSCDQSQIDFFTKKLKQETYKEKFTKVWVGSQYFAERCILAPSMLIELDSSGSLEKSYGENDFNTLLNERLESLSSFDELYQALRDFRKREISRIIWRDLNRLAATEETVRDMSLMADAVISSAYRFIFPVMVEKYGAPIGKDSGEVQHLVVLGMGKLGAYELNLSSDIDLIFAYPESGDTEGADRSVSNHQFFIYVAQELIRAIDKSIGGDFVFRVDMRLRPYGDSGALTLSFDAMEEYYQFQGRDWERYAMIKARVVGGDAEKGAALLGILRPFVYRRYIDFSVIDSLREMKALIGRQVQRKGMQGNVKLGYGGIREIEFIAQCFQLIRGGRELELQERSLLKVLVMLAEKEILPIKAVEELKASYLYLRDVEHALQAYQDKQTQDLPTRTEDQFRLAWVMGFESWEEFHLNLEPHRVCVREHFQNVIEEPAEDNAGEVDGSTWVALWESIGDDSADPQLFIAQGFDNAEVSIHELETSYKSICTKVGQSESRERIDFFMPRLLEAVSVVENSSETLSRLLRFLDSVIRRTSYLVLLNENPEALSKLVMLFSVSPWISEQMTNYPVLLDECLKSGVFELPPEKRVLIQELRDELLQVPEDDDERIMNVLRYFRMSHVLHIAASEESGRLPLMKVSDYLTLIAEVVVEAVVQIAWHQMLKKYGRPQIKNDAGELVAQERPEFSVVGYGKFGGIELGYASDLDLVFIGNSGNQMTDGTKEEGTTSVPNTVFYLRMAQRVIHTLHVRTQLGQLYEVDMRLRPSGDKGELVSSQAAFERYIEKDAWVWEQQALVRARFITGPNNLRTAFDDIRCKVLRRERDLGELREEVDKMREKMVSHLGTKSAKTVKNEIFHLKQDPGGIVDIEFMVQYAVLAWAHQYPSLAQFSDNIRILEALKAEGLFTEAESDSLTEAYKRYRAMGHRLALQQKSNKVTTSEFDESRRLVREIWQKLLKA